MSTEQADPRPVPEPGEQEPGEQELRAAYEAEMRRLTSADMLLQATVSLLNIGGYRLGLAGTETGAGAGTGAAGGPDEQVRDLEQVRDAIDGAKALLPILERRLPQELRPLRDALSQLQLAYAREAGAQAPPTQAGAEEKQPPAPSAPAAGQAQGAQQPKRQEPGPAETSGRLWVPGR